jgi:hypothetical protein
MLNIVKNKIGESRVKTASPAAEGFLKNRDYTKASFVSVGIKRELHFMLDFAEPFKNRKKFLNSNMLMTRR